MGDNTRMNQLTFGDPEYFGKRKRIRREVFLFFIASAKERNPTAARTLLDLLAAP